jgi:WD40 repeat protein
MDKIPTDTLLLIFSFTASDTLFGTVPLVCKRFYSLLINSDDASICRQSISWWQYMFREQLSRKKRHHIIKGSYQMDNENLQELQTAQRFWFQFCEHTQRNGLKEGFVTDTIVLERPHDSSFSMNSKGYVTCMKFVDAYKNISNTVQEYIIAGSNDYLIQVWSRERNLQENWKCKHVVKGHYDAVSCIEVLNSNYFESILSHSSLVNDNNSVNLIIASGSYDKSVKIWSMSLLNDEDMKCVETLFGHRDWIKDIALIASDRTRIASSSRDRTIRVWEYERNKCMNIFEHETTPWTMIDSSRLMRSTILSGASNGVISLWDSNCGRLIEQSRNHYDIVSSIRIVDNYRFVSASFDKSIKMYDIRNFTQPLWNNNEAHKTAISAMEIEHNRIVTISIDGWLKMFDGNTGKCQQTFVTPKIISNTNQRIFRPSRNQTVKFQDNTIIADNDSVDTLTLWTIGSSNTKASGFSPIPITCYRPTANYVDNVSLFQRIHCFDFDSTKIVASVEQHLPMNRGLPIVRNNRNRLADRRGENEVRTRGYLYVWSF